MTGLFIDLHFHLNQGIKKQWNDELPVFQGPEFLPFKRDGILQIILQVA